MLTFDELTLSELDEIELLLGGPVDEATNNRRVASLVLWISERRENPDLDYDEFAAGVTVAELVDAMGAMNAEPVDPTTPRDDTRG